MTITLTLLKCMRCGRPLPAAEDEVAWACANCGQGQQLAEAGLTPVTITWAAPAPNAQNVMWAPMWVFSGTVKFKLRDSYRGDNRPDAFWNSAPRFCIPAYPMEMKALLALATKLTRLPKFPPAGPALNQLQHCTLHPVDAREMVEFVVLTVEAQRSDKLKRAEFTLNLAPPELWVLPLVNEQPAWRS